MKADNFFDFIMLNEAKKSDSDAETPDLIKTEINTVDEIEKIKKLLSELEGYINKSAGNPEMQAVLKKEYDKKANEIIDKLNDLSASYFSSDAIDSIQGNEIPSNKGDERPSKSVPYIRIAKLKGLEYITICGPGTTKALGFPSFIKDNETDEYDIKLIYGNLNKIPSPYRHNTKGEDIKYEFVDVVEEITVGNYKKGVWDDFYSQFEADVKNSIRGASMTKDTFVNALYGISNVGCYKHLSNENALFHELGIFRTGR